MFQIFGGMVSDVNCTHENKSGIAMEKAAFNRKKTFCQQIGLEFKEETSRLLHLEHSTVWWTPQKVDQKYTASFEM
jgi:hypothetical protein